jgi:hypothetical protein
MTFEIEFEHSETPFKADVTLQGKDFLVNINSPRYYETTPTLALTIHEDESMKYDNTMFDDKSFMPAIETAIKNYIHSNNIAVDFHG